LLQRRSPRRLKYESVSTAVVAVAMTVFLLLAAFSPQITVDVPGVGRCRGAACASGGD
jgi:hypothetical protein